MTTAINTAAVADINSRAYIATKVDRFNRATSDRLQLDCLWRIASAADLYPAAILNRTEEDGITPTMRAEILEWLQTAGFTVSL